MEILGREALDSEVVAALATFVAGPLRAVASRRVELRH